MSDSMSIDKKEPTRDGSEDGSIVSSPELEPDPSSAPQESQPAKRKGGRKPIYATSEERKQRNRQAQAAFRERRTEYIKQLEETIRVHESNLSNLQAAHRSAADECLMLRYKNSLLERILLEKGIDVQAELRAKTEQEYDAPNEMIDDVEPETSGPNPYSAYPGVQQQQQHHHHQQQPQQPQRPMHVPPATSGPPGQPTSAAHSEQGAQTHGQGYPSMSQLLDPALDWDPFGLSASMAFPTQFSFDTSNMR
ncbi:hypothetical protein SLS62_004583 [Diatrype stigma]|uniref:BZIP domain-containing protein n=1 Tax=Diatrype stigma TaxID=117547 RepID=A0AAN9UT30_9PEZI